MAKKKIAKEVLPIGRPKLLEKPEELLALFERYVKWTKDNPYKVIDWVGARARQVVRYKEKPLTIEGIYVFCRMDGFACTLKDYFSNRDGRYEDFVPIVTHIKTQIRLEQLSGGMAGMYNSSLTARLNNLVDQQQTTIIEQPLFPEEKKDD